LNSAISPRQDWYQTMPAFLRRMTPGNENGMN
jgi:hypothetical protein